MGFSVPASLASVLALFAVAEVAGVPYQPLTPPHAKMSSAAKPAEPAKTVARPAALTATSYRPDEPLPPSPSKASSGARSTVPAKTASGKTAAPAPTVATSTIVYVIRRTEDSWTVMDPAAVEKVPGGPIRRTYSIIVRRNLLNGGPPQPGYVRTLNEFDCEAMKFRWRTFTIYNRFGAVVVKQDNADPAFKPLERGSDEEAIFRTVCDGSGGGSVVAAPSLGLLVIGLMQGWDDAAITSAMSELPLTPPPAAPTKPGRKTPSR